MRFPYKRSVGQDLRDLFQIERASAQARDLGLSSLRQGDGAIRLLGADGAAVHAIIGDLPGGGFGVGIASGGQIVSLQSYVGTATAGLSAQVAELQTNRAWADTQITNLNAGNAANITRLNALEDNRTWADTQISNLLGFATTTASRLSSLDSNRDWQDGQITNINTNLGTLNSNRTWADGQISNLLDRMSYLEARVAAAEGRETNLRNLVEHHEDLLAEYRTRIARLESHNGIPW